MVAVGEHSYQPVLAWREAFDRELAGPRSQVNDPLHLFRDRLTSRGDPGVDEDVVVTSTRYALALGRFNHYSLGPECDARVRADRVAIGGLDDLDPAERCLLDSLRRSPLRSSFAAAGRKGGE